LNLLAEGCWSHKVGEALEDVVAGSTSLAMDDKHGGFCEPDDVEKKRR